MASPQFPRNPNTQSVRWFLDLNSAGRLDLDPPYQRRSVWNMEFRRFFIDSVLRNYPTQSIFLEYDIDPDISTVYRVLDGKQRLTTILMFTTDEFQTSDSVMDLNLANLYYSDLPRDWKTRLLSYIFTVENVNDATPAELNQAFDRLNRNVLRLNKQELRHAKFGGEFITKMEHIAQHDVWEQVGLVTPARRRRMLDVEYVSELYVIGLRGIQDGKNYLDDVFADYDGEIENEARAEKYFKRTRDFIQKLDGEMPLPGTRYSNVADFYSLWAAVGDLLDSGEVLDAGEAADSLREFEAELLEQETQRAQTYLLAARQGSNKKPNRERRTAILKDILTADA
ncbi:MAG: DUF262 domain-containing protein [Actinomycetota bacterium]|nr:DUF262 domain-containing protein [Actinomycetota bacterium]MDQ3954108.1 DUF262 domain-containing protein [Actinomycetota bacterium]